jgi:hypothetical protein
MRTGYDSGTVVPLEPLEQEHSQTDANRLVVADAGLQRPGRINLARKWRRETGSLSAPALVVEAE